MNCYDTVFIINVDALTGKIVVEIRLLRESTLDVTYTIISGEHDMQSGSRIATLSNNIRRIISTMAVCAGKLL